MDAIDSFGEALVAAGRRRARRHWISRAIGPRVLPSRLRARGPFTLIAFVLLLGAGATIGLAATGVLTGAPVPTNQPSIATAGTGVPVLGGSRLLPLRAADPAGGLPWGMRVIHTTRGVICWQIGRIDHGQLGQLGINGAFNNDGRFHALSPDALPGTLPYPDSFEGCNRPGDTFAADSLALGASAASNPPAGEGVARDRREISFGLLGTHALSITYRSGSTRHTERVLPGLGAYLLVQRYTGGGLGGSRTSNGIDYTPEVAYSIPATPTGVLTAITYRYADTTCTASGTHSYLMMQRCGLSHSAPPRPTPLRAVNEAIRARLQIGNRVITGAQVTFTAPYPVTSDNQFYSAVTLVGRSIGQITGTNANITKGAKVSIPIARLLPANGRTVRIEIQYVRFPPGTLGLQATTIGTVTIHEPPGTRLAPGLLPPALGP